MSYLGVAKSFGICLNTYIKNTTLKIWMKFLSCVYPCDSLLYLYFFILHDIALIILSKEEERR